MSTFDQIVQQVRSRQFAPLYYLHGEEEYFIDKLVGIFQDQVLAPADNAFNREIFFGADATAAKILNACKSFPVFATLRLVIVKEAQRLNKKELEKLVPYLQQPVKSSLLVLAFKGKAVGLPKEGEKAVKQNGEDFESKKLYENDIQQWVEIHLKEIGFQYDPGIPDVLTAQLGLNISLIENEIEKMAIYLRAMGIPKLSKDFVYDMINLDREFNVFELIHALSERNIFRSNLIIDRLTQNTKLNPPTVLLSNLYRFFHQLSLVHSYKLRDPNAIKNQLKVNYYAAKDFVEASRHYPAGVSLRNIQYIQETDLQLKGITSTDLPDRHLLKTLIWKLMH